MSTLAYHPGTGHAVVVDDGALDHLRAAGWLSMAEHEANLAEAAARAEAAAEAGKSSSKPAAPAASKEK
jgi:hypothetical protein